MQVMRVGTSMDTQIAAHNTRTPGGHPEGYLEAFANIYRNFSLTVRAKANGEEPTPEMLDFPGVEDGIRGMQFIDTTPPLLMVFSQAFQALILPAVAIPIFLLLNRKSLMKGHMAGRAMNLGLVIIILYSLLTSYFAIADFF